MEDKISKISILANGCVILVDRDHDRINYLNNILQFIDYSLEIAQDASELKVQLSGREEGICQTVVLGPDLADSEVDQLLEVSHQAPLKPALLLLKSEEGAVLDHRSDASFLGTLTLPARFDELHDLLHRAQIYQEQQIVQFVESCG